MSLTTGLVSGTDYKTLIDNLITAESTAIEPTKDRLSSAQTELAVVQAINLKFSYVAIDAEALGEEDTFRKRTATSEDDDVFTASASSAASTGSYGIRVDALAQAEQVVGSAVDSDSTYTGSLTITVGEGRTYTIDADDASLSELASVINNSSIAEVTAQVIEVGDGTSRLMLTSNKSGAANTIVLGGDLGSSEPFAGLTTLTTAQDASVTVRIGSDNTVEITRTSASNSITDLVSGVDVALTGTSEDFTTLTVAEDASAIGNYIKLFIEDLNTALSAYATDSGYDASTETAGALFTNSQIRAGVRSLNSAMSTTLADGTSLEDLGITFDPETGLYDLDEDALQTLLTGDPDAAAALFVDSGIGKAIIDAISDLTDVTLSDQEEALDSSIDSYNATIEAFDETMQGRRERYETQFTALETTLAKLDSQKDALTSFIDGLNKSDS